MGLGLALGSAGALSCGSGDAVAIAVADVGELAVSFSGLDWGRCAARSVCKTGNWDFLLGRRAAARPRPKKIHGFDDSLLEQPLADSLQVPRHELHHVWLLVPSLVMVTVVVQALGDLLLPLGRERE